MNALHPSGSAGSPDSAPAFPLPEQFKIRTHLLCILAPAAVTILIGILSGGSVIELLIYLLLSALYAALLYFVAGGFEWTASRLPVWRIVLFWVLGDLVFALVAWGMWYFIRRGMARAYRIPIPAAMGRLMATGRRPAAERYVEDYVEKAGFSPASHQAAICANCGAATNMGASYNFVFGLRLWTLVSVGKSTTSFFNMSDSPDVYLCNKCVALAHLRNTMSVLKKVLIALAVVAAVLLPVYIITADPAYILPAIFLVPVAAAAVAVYLNLEGKEEAPLGVYANLYNNPGLPSAKYKLGEGWAEEKVRNDAEKLAIRLMKPSLTTSRSSVFFTHKEWSRMLVGT